LLDVLDALELRGGEELAVALFSAPVGVAVREADEAPREVALRLQHAGEENRLVVGVRDNQEPVSFSSHARSIPEI